MGDIILGTFVLIVIAFVLGLYWYLTNKKPALRNLAGLISLTISIGGLLGLFVTIINYENLTDEPAVFSLSILFFLAQSTAGFFTFKMEPRWLSVLIATLTMQIPVIESASFWYSNQTLIRITIGNFLSFLDIEPGSYIFYTTGDVDDLGFGINLVPILLIVLLIRNTKLTFMKM